MKNINKFSHILFKFSPLKFFTSRNKPIYDNITTTNERLENKARNVGSAADQIQNYEKSILIKKRDFLEMDEKSNIAKDLDSIFDELESTNSKYLENINDPEKKNLKADEISFNDYLRESDKIFSLLRHSFNELISQDSNIQIENDRSGKNLYIKVNVRNVGTYIVAKEIETLQIALTSPLTGLFKYKYNPVSRYWISTKDSHIMDELLIREFCQHSKGLLIIDH